MAQLEILKPGQGKLARGAAYFLGMLLVVFGGISLYATINVPFDANATPTTTWEKIEHALHVSNVPILGHISVYRIIAFVVVLFGALALHLLLNRPAAVDTLIDTEQELKKVSWPSRREVWNATLVVVLVTLTMAMILYGFDRVLQFVFRLVIGGN